MPLMSFLQTSLLCFCPHLFECVHVRVVVVGLLIICYCDKSTHFSLRRQQEGKTIFTVIFRDGRMNVIQTCYMSK